MRRRTGYVLVGLLLLGASAARADNLHHSGQSLTHSATAIGYSAVASAQLVSGVLAIPLGVSAQVGRLSGALSDELWDAANAPIGEPLPVTEDVITIGPPPAQALEEELESEPER